MQAYKIYVLIFMLVVAHSKLVYLTELFRHGARYPSQDSYDGKQTKPFHNQLTSIGMRQQYLLGSYVKRDYVDQLNLFNSTFNPSQVQIFSDGVQRCDQSAYAHAAGLFQLGKGATIPPEVDRQFLQPPFELLSGHLREDQQFALDGGYQPVPVKKSAEYFPTCPDEPIIIAKRSEVIATAFAELQLEQSLFTEKMRLLFNLSLAESNLMGLVALYDTVICDTYLGRPLPKSFTDSDFEQLKYIQNYLFILLCAGEYARVISTPIAAAMISKMQQVIAGQFDAKKLTIYSAHDSNVAPMLSFFNLSSAECVKNKYRNISVKGNCGEPVPFASNLIFELHQRDNNDLPTAAAFYVRIKYNGQYYQLCETTSTQCDFQDFRTRVKRQLVDYNKQCGIK